MTNILTKLPESKIYFRRQEAADYLAVCIRQLDEWKATGELPFIYLSRRLVVFARSDLDQFMMRHRVAVDE